MPLTPGKKYTVSIINTMTAGGQILKLNKTLSCSAVKIKRMILNPQTYHELFQLFVTEYV